MNLDGLKASSVCVSFIRIVSDEISASRYSSPIGIISFRSEHADSASVGDSEAGEDLVFVDEEDGICAFNTVRREPLS